MWRDQALFFPTTMSPRRSAPRAISVDAAYWRSSHTTGKEGFLTDERDPGCSVNVGTREYWLGSLRQRKARRATLRGGEKGASEHAIRQWERGAAQWTHGCAFCGRPGYERASVGLRAGGVYHSIVGRRARTYSTQAAASNSGLARILMEGNQPHRRGGCVQRGWGGYRAGGHNPLLVDARPPRAREGITRDCGGAVMRHSVGTRSITAGEQDEGRDTEFTYALETAHDSEAPSAPTLGAKTLETLEEGASWEEKKAQGAQRGPAYY
ncbi:hypothetical protein DFH09DRAFT_1289291, partial [Mycena vulgaris]